MTANSTEACSPVARSSHSSGPSQNAARLPFAANRQAVCGNDTPNASPAAGFEEGRLRNDSFAASGSTASIAVGTCAALPANSANECDRRADRSSIETLSLRVVENRRNDLDRNGAARHRQRQARADARASATNQRERDRTI